MPAATASLQHMQPSLQCGGLLGGMSPRGRPRRPQQEPGVWLGPWQGSSRKLLHCLCIDHSCACASSSCMPGACRAPLGSPVGMAALEVGAKFTIAPSPPLACEHPLAPRSHLLLSRAWPPLTTSVSPGWQGRLGQGVRSWGAACSERAQPVLVSPGSTVLAPATLARQAAELSWTRRQAGAKRGESTSFVHPIL